MIHPLADLGDRGESRHSEVAMSTPDPEPLDLTPSSAFRQAESDVVLEAFEDETIAVNLATGRYYSIDLIGSETLELLVSGRRLGAVVEHLAVRYGAEPRDVEIAVSAFARRLLEEGLVKVMPGAEPGEPDPPSAPAAGIPFAPPQLAVYSDMEDLLLLDPIHDVDDSGWPARVDAADPERAESREA